MSSIIVAGDTSGTITLQAPAVSGSTTLTLPTTNGTILTTANTFGAGTGPAFSAYGNTASQSVTSNVNTKVILNTKLFDTANCFDATTNYRFTPTTAGYYQINAGIRIAGTLSGFCNPYLLKNSAGYRIGTALNSPTGGSIITLSDIVYLNGSTDYIELYGTIVGTSTAFTYSAPDICCFMSGALVRAA